MNNNIIDLLKELDAFALSYDKYDFGLPMYDDEDNPINSMVDIVKKWHKKQIEELPDSFQWLIDFNENQDLDMAKKQVRWTTEECADLIDEYIKRNIK